MGSNPREVLVCFPGIVIGLNPRKVLVFDSKGITWVQIPGKVRGLIPKDDCEFDLQGKQELIKCIS